jgi:glycosidase
MKFIIALFYTLLTSISFAQNINIYPTHWWVGMKNTSLQLMIRGKNIAQNNFSISYPGVQLRKVNKVQNKNYVFLDLVILPSANPGSFRINISGSGKSNEIVYELKRRSPENGRSRISGITSEDLIYLIMPDRFSNGDPANDRVPGMRDQSLNRDTVFNRHGGDLKGIQNHLDYLQNLGVTAIWLNPVIENDMPNRTEHGYAFTDHYTVDARIGGNKAYHELTTAIHQKGLKIIQDAVYNHTGIEHFLYRDMPDSTWFHKWPVYTESSYKDQPLFDPYSAPSDKKRMSEGWFGAYPHMPDINQKNPFFANFLIQHAVWSTEEYGLDGWRIDTYAYNDLEFMNRCNKALLDEYPKIHLFGETWVHGMVNQLYFTENNINVPFKSTLPAVTDFQTSLYGILPALKESFGWTEGVTKLYNTLAQDFLYKHPMKQVIFLDNHDKTRFFSEIGEDFQKYKMGIGWLLTARGIPQLYYGTEVLMKGEANPDGNVRRDFPGGWADDKENKFTASGRSAMENEAFEYVQKLANFRKTSSAIRGGKLLQYVPEDWVYTYFRYDEKQTVMVVMNTANEEKAINVTRFKEGIKDFKRAKNIITNDNLSLTGDWKLPPKTIWILELSK